jgi:hypothetical protein
MTEDLSGRFYAVHATMAKALIDYGVGRKAQNGQMALTGQKAMTDSRVEATLADIGAAIQKRLRYFDA